MLKTMAISIADILLLETKESLLVILRLCQLSKNSRLQPFSVEKGLYSQTVDVI